MNAKRPQVTPFVGPDASVQETASSHKSHLGLLGLYEVSALVVILVYLDTPTYIYTPALLAFFFAAAPLLVLRFRSLSSCLISPFSLWAFALIMLNIAHLLDALIDGDQHG